MQCGNKQTVIHIQYNISQQTLESTRSCWFEGDWVSNPRRRTSDGQARSSLRACLQRTESGLEGGLNHSPPALKAVLQSLRTSCEPRLKLLRPILNQSLDLGSQAASLDDVCLGVETVDADGDLAMAGADDAVVVAFLRSLCRLHQIRGGRRGGQVYQHLTIAAAYEARARCEVGHIGNPVRPTSRADGDRAIEGRREEDHYITVASRDVEIGAATGLNLSLKAPGNQHTCLELQTKKPTMLTPMRPWREDNMTRPRAFRPSLGLAAWVAELITPTLTLMGPCRVLNDALTSAGLRDLRRHLSALFEASDSSSGTDPKALRTFFACAFSTERSNLPRQLLLMPVVGMRGSTR